VRPNVPHHSPAKRPSATLSAPNGPGIQEASRRGLEEKPILPLPDWMAVHRELKRRARKAIRRAARRAPASSVSVIP
jgi:hypothetical protein